MLKSLPAFAFAVTLLLAIATGGSVRAQTQIGPFAGGVLCCSFALTAGEYAGQSFQVPAGQTGLTSASLSLGDNSAAQGTTFVLELRTYTGGILGATALAVSAPFSTTVSPFAGGQVFTLAPVGGLSVTPLATYAIIARNTAGQGTFVPMINATGVYAGGQVISSAGTAQPTRDAFFQVNFGSVAVIPTLSEWAMILLGLTLAAGAVVSIQRRGFRA